MQRVPAWTDRPGPSEPRIGTRVYVLPAKSKPSAFWFLGNVDWCAVHWALQPDEKWRTVPCIGTLCPWCEADGLEPFKKGYVAAQHWRLFPAHIAADGEIVKAAGKWTPCVLDLPTDAADQVQRLADRFGTLRGVVAMCSRPGQSKNSPVRIEYAEHKELVNPPSVDVRKVCENMWRRFLCAKGRTLEGPAIYTGDGHAAAGGAASPAA